MKKKILKGTEFKSGIKTKNKFYKFLCFTAGSCFGVGFFPFASATVGSFATLPFAFICGYFYGFQGFAILTIFSFVIGVIASKEILKYTNHDPSIIIIDEVVGLLITFMPIANHLLENLSAWWVYVVGFFLFRYFDIFKPKLAKWADEKLENAWGVMLDDVFAGLYAAIILYIVYVVKGILL